jgi:hypothetical protein
MLAVGAIVVALVAAVAVVISAVNYGTKYIDKKLLYHAILELGEPSHDDPKV